MKINCNVCNKDEASVFCPADDAALCAACDHRVHHANNLAGKHHRFSLLHPSPEDSPLCDICKEEKALMFCHQDRAILCKNCDFAIHKVNEHKLNHCRFLLTGVKLSPVALLSTAGNGVVHEQKPKSRDQEPITVKKQGNGSGHGSTAASSISEYLIETLPGWHVEDFLDSPSTFSNDILQVNEDDSGLFWDDEVLKGSMNDCFSPETMGIWVPQAPPPAAPPPPTAPPPSLLLNPYNQLQSYSNLSFGSQMTGGSSPFFAPVTNLNKISKSNGKSDFEDGNCFAVPQISPPMSTIFKRSTTIRY
ncbi:hypothetical protein R6Q59_034272 [Mikania micrantha]